MTIAELLSSLDRVRRASRGWMACCPAHDDRNPSLSISEKDGRILLHCFAGCTVEGIVSALGLGLADLYADTRANPPGPPAPLHRSRANPYPSADSGSAKGAGCGDATPGSAVVQPDPEGLRVCTLSCPGVNDFRM